MNFSNVYVGTQIYGEIIMTEEVIDAQLQFELEIKEIFFDKDGLKVIVEVGYMGIKNMTIKNHIWKDKFITELVTTNNSGSTERKTVKIGEKIKIIES